MTASDLRRLAQAIAVSAFGAASMIGCPRGDPRVGLVFVDEAAKAYLSITGRATVARSREEADAIWKPTDTMWWPRGGRPIFCHPPQI
jgi:hypothetical protein